MSELPKGWAAATLGDICSQPEQRIPAADEDLTYIDITSVDRDLKVITRPQRIRGADAPSRARKTIEAGDVIVSMTRPNLNAVALVGAQYHGCIASTGFDVLKPIVVEPRWIFAVVKSAKFVDAMCEKVQGALYPAVKAADIRDYEIPLPPLPEQIRIAKKLDELLSQVNILKTRIESIPALLKRFRQSILTAAVSGRLTEEWRQNDEYIDTDFQLQTPSSWKISTVGNLAEVKGGKRLPKGEALTCEDTGYPYIRAGQLKDGTVSKSGQLFIPSHVQSQISKYIVNSGDVYITIVGACIGDAGVIPERCNSFNLTENAAKISDFKAPLNSKYLASWLRSQYLQQLIRYEIKSAAQGKLALKRIKELPVPYPSIEEQTEIVRRIELLFAFADQLEAKVLSAESSIHRLTQSILAKAFRGELLPQDSNDEPASVMLERIKAERNAVPKAKGKKRASA